jgi:predicted permease
MTQGDVTMATLREWINRLLGTFRARRTDRDLEEELRLHLELAAEDARHLGDPRARVVRAAGIRAGGVAHTMEALRDQRGLPWLDDLVRDVRHAVRLLRRDPLFTGVAVLSLALGIGANSAIFSLADASILRPLPVREPGAIVTVSAAGPDDRRGGLNVSYPNYRDLREPSQSFDGLVAYQRETFSFARSRDAVRDMRLGMLVSDNFFTVLGIQPPLGRAFTMEEGAVPGRDAVVVLGFDFWKNVLGEDRSMLNGAVWINGIEFTVVGVAPESFTGMDPYIRPSFYLPIMMTQQLSAARESPLEDRSARSFVVKGRVKSGVSARSAQAELDAIWSRLTQQYPDANRNRTIAVRTELESRIQSDPTTAVAMAMLMALVALVLLIACANVANLMLGRARARSREVAIRLALGVSRSRLFCQLLTESVLLAFMGCAVGLGFAYGSIRLFQTIQVPAEVPITIAPQLDHRVLVFSLVAAAASVVLFGLVPARQSLNTQLVPTLKSSELEPIGRHRTIGRNVLVVAQVALSMVLLVATGMLLDGFRKALIVDPGFRTDHLIMLSLDTSFVRYTPVETRSFYRNLVNRAQALPGVASAALTSAVPLDRGGTIEHVIPEGHQFPQGQDTASVFAAVVDEHYFTTMKTEIVRGRAFIADDNDGSRRVAIVNEEFANRYWPGQDPIGKRVHLAGRAPWLEVVGLAKTGKYLIIGEAPMPFLYLPFAQNERTGMSLLVETTNRDAGSLAAPLRDVVRGLDVNQPAFNVRAFSSFYQQRAIAIPLGIARMVGTMGLIGLTLALIGLYGLVAYSVERRTREIGIRMAIGAGRSDVLRMVLRQGFTLSIAGIVAGGVASLAVAHVLPAVLLGSGTPNPAIYLIVPAALMCLTMAASYVPARRASLVDPLHALRYE